MSQTITLAGPTRGMHKLYEAYEFGRGSGLNGLTDAARAASDSMGGMLAQMRELHEARVVELRERNLAEAAEARG
ncbi:hypothetical protein [Streptomyces sp. NPDC029554]|uniref:hypothetical protein n=1 Tax=Streptomyces sp. NPDC029554 TaxID=3155126 RepID=UPI0033C93B60